VLHAGVLLLRVLEAPPVSTFAHMPQLAVDLRDSHRDQGQQYLEGLCERLPADLRSFHAKAVISGQVTGTIRDVAQREGCDTIAWRVMDAAECRAYCLAALRPSSCAKRNANVDGRASCQPN
jgi:hypothetical protein